MLTTVLFDLGNTLVQSFERAEFPDLLETAISDVEVYLTGRGLPVPPRDEVWRRVHDENHEAADFRMRPMEDRLARIFAVEEAPLSGDAFDALCRQFMRPVFARSQVYDDSVPVLAEVRRRGLWVAIVSNTTWGSPAGLHDGHAEPEAKHPYPYGSAKATRWRRILRCAQDDLLHLSLDRPLEDALIEAILDQAEIDGHQVPILGGPDEDDIIRKRLAEGSPRLDGPKVMQALLRRTGGKEWPAGTSCYPQRSVIERGQRSMISASFVLYLRSTSPTSFRTHSLQAS